MDNVLFVELIFCHGLWWWLVVSLQVRDIAMAFCWTFLVVFQFIVILFELLFFSFRLGETILEILDHVIKILSFSIPFNLFFFEFIETILSHILSILVLLLQLLDLLSKVIPVLFLFLEIFTIFELFLSF